MVEKGQIVKLVKDKKGIIQREQLTQHWTDWIDYWSVDFDFESKREIIRVKDPESGETSEEWTAISSLKTNGRASAPKKTAPWN